MSSKTKFSKLQLPKNTRTRSNSQISKFFSQPEPDTNDDCCSSESSGLQTDHHQIDPIPEETTSSSSWKSCKSQDIILIVSDDEEDIKKDEHINGNFSKVKRKKKHNEINRKTTVSKFFNDDDTFNDFVETKEPILKDNNCPSLSTKLKKNTEVKKPTKSVGLGRRKRQTKIKTAFAKHEEMFSRVMEQHSLVDDINPEELQLALAMSLSEATAKENFMYDEVLGENGASCTNNSNNIREKLQCYGFKTNKNLDYELTYLLPQKKSKWCNKFTPLTLRNAEKQQRKATEKIESLLNEQKVLIPPPQAQIATILNDPIDNIYNITSNLLRKFIPQVNIIKPIDPHPINVDDCATDNDMFYVKELFQPSKTKIGNLLKDFHKIPGRDLSPKKKTCAKYLDISYDEINLDSFKYQTQANCTTEPSVVDGEKIEADDFAKSPLHKKLKLIDNIMSPLVIDNEICAEIEQNAGRMVISPDIFAEYEIESSEEQDPTIRRIILEEYAKNPGIIVEENAKNPGIILEENTKNPGIILEENISCQEDQNFNENIIKLNNSNDKINITVFEKFSSDEVKISGCVKEEDSYTNSYKKNSLNDNNCTIDLTQDFEQNNSEFLLKDISNSQNQTQTEQFLNSQISCTGYTDKSYSNDCIILSDDEVNYSIKIANQSICNNEHKIDLTISSSSSSSSSSNSDTDDNFIYNKQISFTEFIDENNFSFNTMKNHLNIEEDKNISYLETLEENEVSQTQETQDVSPIKSNYSFSSFLNESDYQRENSTKSLSNYQNNSLHEFDFISPSKIIISPVKKMPITPPNQLKKSNQNNSISKEETKSQTSSGSDNEIHLLLRKYGVSSYSDKLKNPTANKWTSIIQTKSCRKTLSESFVSSPIHPNSKCYEFRHNHRSQHADDDDDGQFSDLDEIDKLIYGSPLKKTIFNQPKDLDKLLTANITPINTKQPPPVLPSNEDPENRIEIVNDREYIIKMKNITKKPNFARMDSPTRLKELHKVGLKPLKKKQAVIMLEYIYNQLHPYIINDENLKKKHNLHSENLIIKEDVEISSTQQHNNFKLKDCFGDVLLENDGFVFTECQQNELFFLQTNIYKKISTTLLPLHIAWYNLIKSSPLLREAILYYEPIDLQEIYLFFKRIGYRYEPKDLKKFFDNRCIIFRYDLTESNKNNGRVRQKKPKKLLSQR